jgi:DNA polymerase I
LNSLAVVAPSFIHAFQDSDSTIITVSRDAAGQRLLRSVPAEHVVFMLSEEVDAAFERTLRNTQLVKGIKREGRFVRVSFRTHDARDRFCFNYASPVKQLGLKTFEGDVSPVLRHVLENKVKIARPRRVYLDIETDSRVPFSRKGDMRVLAWCLVDEDGAAHMGVLEEDTDRAERDLLVQFWEALNQFDQVLAWNGDNFDFPVIAERSSRRGIQVDPRHWLWLDHLTLFARMNKNAAESAEEKQSMSLNAIAQAIVGEGKEETPPEVAAIFGNKSLGALAWQLWEAGGEMRQLLARYNWRDTDLLRRIEEESGYVALFDTLCDVCHVFGDSNGLNPTKQVDGFMLELGMEADYKFPSQTYRESIDKFKGAFVMEPEGVGIQRNVHVCDFASLYPSIILTWNMSPETLHRGAGKKPSVEDGYALSPLTGFMFSQETKGILVRALETALEMRKYWTALKASLPPGTPEWVSADRMATAYKVFANSFYGVVGSPFSRFFERAIAESVTQCGVWLAKGTAEEARKWGFTVIYMDTDSVFVKGCTREDFERFTAFCNSTLYPAMLAVVGCRENKIKLAYEKEFDRIIFCAGKKYVGAYLHYKGTAANENSKPEIKGIEYKRGDSLLLARDLQAEVIDMLVGGLKVAPVDVPTEDIALYQASIERARQKVLEAPLTLEQVRVSKSVSMDLSEYKQGVKLDGTLKAQPPHVMLAKMMKARGQEVSEGTRVEYVMVDELAKGTARFVLAEDFDGTVDRFYLWEKLVFPPTLRLLSKAFPDVDWKPWKKVRPPKPKAPRKPRQKPGRLSAPVAALSAPDEEEDDDEEA